MSEIRESEDLVKMKADLYWNREKDSIEIRFSEEETPTGRAHQHPVTFWYTGDGRVMKMEINKVNFHY